MKKRATTKINKKQSDPDMLPEYDFSKGVRGKYVQRLGTGFLIDKQLNQSWETVEYTDNPELPDLEDIEVVADFLPRPEELRFKGIEPEEATASAKTDGSVNSSYPVP